MTQLIKANEKLDFVINLLTSLDNIRFEIESNSIFGNLSKRSNQSYEHIQKQLQFYDFDTTDNEEVSRLITVPLTGTNIYYDLDQYLKKDSRRLDESPTKSFYIYDQSIKFTPGANCNNKELNNVFLIAELFANLKLISDLQGDAGNRSFIIFIGKKNLKIYSDYCSEDLSRDFILVKNFIREYIQNDFHQEDRHLAVINGLHESYKENEISISTFLKGFETFFRMVKSNFQLYMDKFSFNDFKNQIEEDRREYTIKINKVFSDMQNQLLTLPIATVLAAGQMSIVNSAGDFIKNILIMVGIIIFCVFVLMQITNQEVTLQALDEEIKLRKSAMESKEESDYRADFLNVYLSLDSRVSKLDGNLSLVKHITIAATCLVLLVFIARFFI